MNTRLSGQEITSRLYKDATTLPDVHTLRSLDVVARLGGPQPEVNANTPVVNFTVEALDSLLALMHSAKTPQQDTLGLREYGFFGLGRRDGDSFFVDSWYLLDESHRSDGGAKVLTERAIGSAWEAADANSLDVVIRAHDHHESGLPEPSGIDVQDLFSGVGFADMIVQSTRTPFTLGVYCPGQSAREVVNLGINVVNPRGRSREDINNLLHQFAYYIGDDQVQIAGSDGSQYTTDYTFTSNVGRGQPHPEAETIVLDDLSPPEIVDLGPVDILAKPGLLQDREIALSLKKAKVRLQRPPR